MGAHSVCKWTKTSKSFSCCVYLPPSIKYSLALFQSLPYFIHPHSRSHYYRPSCLSNPTQSMFLSLYLIFPHLAMFSFFIISPPSIYSFLTFPLRLSLSFPPNIFQFFLLYIIIILITTIIYTYTISCCLLCIIWL